MATLAVVLVQLDPGVVRRAQRGDEEAFSVIVRTYEAPVFNFVLRMVGDRELAEDLTQDVFLRVFRSLPRYAHRSKFTTWLFQVAKNLVFDDVRARMRRPQNVELVSELPIAAWDAPIEQAETISAIWAAVEQLSPDLKTALLLRDVVGLSYTEIAETLEITMPTVKWRIYKAREDVQRALGSEGMAYAPPDEPAVAGVAAFG
jgi:RNA polymerase sigma-70 factor (ECF subfamily)